MIDKATLDQILCLNSKKYHLNKTVTKAIVECESSYNDRAYRYEPAFFKNLILKEPYWADKDPSIVSASYGLAQIMFTTAWAMGMKPANWKTMTHEEFQGLAEKLYDPVINLELQGKLLRTILDRVWAEGIPQKFDHISAWDCCLARYNGGSWQNPSDDGTLRNQKYVDRIWRTFEALKPKEKPCEQTQPV